MYNNLCTTTYVQQLEVRLDAQLFHCITRRVTLSDIGLAYFDSCILLLDQFDELEEILQVRQDQHVDILNGGFDLAIRFGPLQNSTLIAGKLLTMRLVVFVAPEYINTDGEPLHPSALSTHNFLLKTSSSDPEHWEFTSNGKVEKYRVSGSFTANSPRAVASMAVGGLGIGRCPLYTVEAFLKSGEF
jgi:DNA-binding transcriptional LysR family regulator